MKNILILACILLLATTAIGQTRKRTSKSAPAKTTKAVAIRTNIVQRLSVPQVVTLLARALGSNGARRDRVIQRLHVGALA